MASLISNTSVSRVFVGSEAVDVSRDVTGQ
jgi:hypothetical protein